MKWSLPGGIGSSNEEIHRICNLIARPDRWVFPLLHLAGDSIMALPSGTARPCSEPPNATQLVQRMALMVMMLVMLLLFGIYAFFAGKVHLTKRLKVEGAGARLAGLVLLVPPFLSTSLLVCIASLESGKGRGLDDPVWQDAWSWVTIVATQVCVCLAIGLGIFYRASPPR